uniref:Uncharacterized protein n=1 Tax=Takifugu rubripes TaxID=31033 RepID=A0A3B5KMY9_TAKRU
MGDGPSALFKVIYLVSLIVFLLQALPIWGLAIPLPAVLIITLSLYLVVLGIGFWLRSCLKPVCMEMGFILLYTERKHMWHIHFPQCANWDCACTCQPPECDSCNCLCFEIRVR